MRCLRCNSDKFYNGYCRHCGFKKRQKRSVFGW